MTRGMRRWVACAALLFVPTAGCAATGADDDSSSGATVLHWYTPPDRVDTRALAAACSDASGGKYTISVRELPADFSERRAELIRRLAGKDPSIDLISLDTALTAEFGAAKLLAPVPDALEPGFTAGVFESALAASTFDGELVSVPWWFDPQLLWFRKSVAQRAGLDMSKPVTWEALIDGVARAGSTIEFEDRSGSATSAWVNALVVGAGGTIVDGGTRDADVGLDSQAGEAAARIIAHYAESGVGTGPSQQAVAAFSKPGGGFLIAGASVISDPEIASIASTLGWAPWPVIGEPASKAATKAAKSIAPLSGRGLAVSLYSPHSVLSFEAIQCLTSETSMQAMMVSSGHSSARATTYEGAQVRSAYPMAETVRSSIENGVTVPSTPYWSQIRYAIEGTWSSLPQVSASRTPATSERAVQALLAGELP